MQAIYLISGLISLAALVVFFAMAHNVANIRTVLEAQFKWGREDLKFAKRVSFYKNKARDLKNEAKDDLTWLMMYELLSEPDNKKRPALYEKLRDEYTALFNEVGGDFPEFPFKK